MTKARAVVHSPQKENTDPGNGRSVRPVIQRGVQTAQIPFCADEGGDNPTGPTDRSPSATTHPIGSPPSRAPGVAGRTAWPSRLSV